MTAAAVLVVAALLMLPAFAEPGSEVDEGLLVAFPARMLHGELPQADFYDPYGPASVWTVAAADEAFGTSLAAERVVGFIYRLMIIGAAFGLALWWGLDAAILAAAIVAALLIGSVAANAVVGFFALALPGYALLVRVLLSRSGGRRPQGRKLLPLAGALLAGSLLMRYDFALGIVLAALPGTLALPPPERRRFGWGVAAGALPFVAHIVIVGPAAFWRSARIAVQARTHPARPPFGSDLAELVVIYALATALLLCAGLLIERRRRRDPEGRVLLGSGLWGVGMVPFALSHLDTAHVLVSSLPALAMLPPAAVVLVREDPLERRAARGARRFALGAVLTLVFFAGGSVIRLSVYQEAKNLLTGSRDASFVVSNRGRTFRLTDAQAAHDIEVMLGAADRIARPGQSVFVGPQDLRTAGANDIFLYFLLDQLKPASYFMPVDPHTINRARNGFARELSRADFALLTTRLTHVPITDVGPTAPNEILASRFCLRAASGTYRLYQRCR